MEKVREVEIVNAQGLHARPSALVVKTATKFAAEVWLESDGTCANAKSILEVMMLACPKGTMLALRCRGDDASEASSAIAALFDSGFGEAY